MKQKCLMLGAGHSKVQRRFAGPNSAPEEETEWVTLDMNPECKPDVLMNLGDIEVGRHLPFAEGTFDEIHTYEILEHYGTQGNYKGFFTGMKELWRILKPGGLLIGTCPSWNVQWAWGDPGHTRIITEGTLAYLTEEMYEERGKGPATDYGRYVRPCWWKQEFFEHNPDTGGLSFAMSKRA